MTHITVSGFPRSGSSMTMQMLHAGGIPCIGEYPAFEEGEAAAARISQEWLERYPRRAVKVLDPQRFRWPSIPRIILWCDRDEEEQAKSQEKFLVSLAGMPPLTRAGRRALVRSYGKDRSVFFAETRGVPRLNIQFEETLADSLGAAIRIAAFLRKHGFDLDVEASRRVVLRRGPACAPDLAVEMSLIGAAA